MIHVGFTGTREPVTALAFALLRGTLTNFAAINTGVVSHSGDCVNADARFHEIAVELGWRTIGHIPLKDHLRAFCKYDEERNPADYQERNRQIVHASQYMLAVPNTMFEKPKGGTWYTIRYARRLNKPLLIIWPNGTTTSERMTDG